MNYWIEAIERPYKVEEKLKEILSGLSFVKSYMVKTKIDRDGLYSFYKDNFTVSVEIINSIYTSHILSGGNKIEKILKQWVPNKYDLYFNISIIDE